MGGGDNPKAYFLLSYSDDAGMTWSEPCLAIDPHDPSLPYSRCTIVGTLWVDPLNRLWLFFNQTLEHFDGKSSNWYIRLDRPEEETLSWSQPRYLSYGCTLNKPIVCQNGDWLLPVSSEAFSPDGRCPNGYSGKRRVSPMPDSAPKGHHLNGKNGNRG